jgi:hypothetical protein
MKTIFKNGVYKRVNDEVAEKKVKEEGYVYVSKSDWKKNDRDAIKSPKKLDEQKSSEEKKPKTKK